jgi:signal transduction histidine kinase
MIRLGLFEQLFWRVLVLMLAAPMLLLFFGHFYLENRILDGWRFDLQQEAAWTARHWGAGPPDRLAKAWGATHSAVRLTITDAKGQLVADSHPRAGRPSHGSAPPGFQALVGRAPVMLQDGPGVLSLERARRFVLPVMLDLKLLVSLLALVALSAAVLYPIVRRLTVAFTGLAGQARRVADGHFGETLDASRQRELSELIGAFNEMSLRLQAQEIRKRRLISDVSHELRSPMARLMALGETIARHPAEAGAHLPQLEAEIALMDRLVGDMLQTARDEDGGGALHTAPVRLHDWAADVFARSRMRIEGAGVACEIEIQGSEAETAIDPQRMVQVVGALVENALAAVAGRPEPLIRLRFETGPTSWSLSVGDNGRGIPANDLPHVFDRFFRVETHRARTSGGVGLGLSIAKGIVEAHHGTIEIDSAQDVGTTVTLTAPL